MLAPKKGQCVSVTGREELAVDTLRRLVQYKPCD